MPICVASGPIVKCFNNALKNVCTRTKLSGVTDHDPSISMTRSV